MQVEAAAAAPSGGGVQGDPPAEGRAPVQVPLRVRSGGRERLNVTLVRPAVVTIPGSLSTHGPTPPIGLAYLAAALRAAGHLLTLVDAAGEAIDHVVEIPSPIGPLHRRGLEPDEIVDRIPVDADVVGLSLMFVHEWPQARDLLDRIRRERPRATIVVGGETATSFWRWMVEETAAIDYIVLGEGEATAIELFARLAGGRPVGPIKGVVAAHVEDRDLEPELPTRLRELGDLPPPAWDLVPLGNYFDHPYFGVDRGRSMPILATRGCPYKCSFCSSPQMWTTRYVVRDPEDVVDEIERYVETYGIRNVNFCDLTAITKRRWTLQFCDALERRGLDLTWQLPVGTRAEALDQEVLQRLYDTGCRNITYAPESGSEHMLRVYDKRVDLTKLLASLRAAHRVGLRTHVNIIIGHPAERRRDLVRSLQFLLKAAAAGCDDCAPIVFCPYPGSKDFEELVAAGTLEVDESTCYIGLSRSSSAAQSFNPRFSARGLRIIQVGLLGIFYTATVLRRPRRILEFVSAQRTGRELTYLDQMVRSLRASRRLAPVKAT